MRLQQSLLFSTAVTLGLTAAAHAEVTLSGDARMGMIQDYGADSVQFTSRTRIRVAMDGETDSGLSFGASVLMHEAELAVPDADAERNWVAGTVYVAGPFGKLSMGDTVSAVEAAVGHVSAVSLTGLGFNNETTLYQKSRGAVLGPSVLYEYYGTSWAGYASVTDLHEYGFGYSRERAMAVGGRYTAGDLTLSAGVEVVKDDVWKTAKNIVVGAAYKMGDFAAKAVYGSYETPYGPSTSYVGEQYYLSVDWEKGPWVVAAFFARPPDSGTSYFARNDRYYGLGAAYDLGGGAALTGGVVIRDRYESPFEFINDDNQTAFDFGLTMSF